jgi:enamine deaminase RidA (YjgF/YER057c/UK114 family)
MQVTSEAIQRIKCRKFSSSSGVDEYYIVSTSNSGIPFNDAIQEVYGWYKASLLENKLDKSSLQFIRFYLSDIANDYTKLIDSEFYKSVSNGAISLVGQPPVNGGPLGIIAYHVKSSTGAYALKTMRHLDDYKNQEVCSTGKNYSMVWTTCFVDNAAADSETQTNNIFDKTKDVLSKYNLTVRNNTVRTWLYMRDVDNNYAGMVKARRELFERIGLTHETRYIASTGIQGLSVDTTCLVSMDGLSMSNICEEQLVRIEAPENLRSTHMYGVTFERGTRVRFGDRSHLHISGTASIDPMGNIMYVGDVCNQLIRTIDNVEALLASQGAVISDMHYLILYMRDPKCYPLIEGILAERIPEDVPIIVVEGPVCRPGWLVEMEGVGIMADENEFPKFE